MNFLKASERMTSYLKQYNTFDEKIKLKIIHTYGVVSSAEYIAKNLQCSPTDYELARHIALLHDIGRFEQLRLYNSFDDSIMPHARCSLDILFKQGLIKEFIPERDYDDIIYTAIKNHGLYLMEEGLKREELFHTKLIRDADKLDNFRVKYESDMITMVDVTEEELGTELITDDIYHAFLNGRPIKNSDRITHMDMWISYLGYIYDLNFPPSFQYLIENTYVEKLIQRVPISNTDTAAKMEEIKKAAQDYLRRNCL